MSKDARHDEVIRNTLLTVAALIGAPFLIWRAFLADRQTKTAQEQTAIAQEKVSIDEQTHYTTLYIKSIEMLGAMRVVKDDKGEDVSEPAMELRLGAIYALERIARDSWKDHWPIMEVLTAYIRENSPYKDGDEPKKISNDIQAIMDVIGRRNEKWIKKEKTLKKKLNFWKCNLRQLSLDEDTNFTGATFSSSYLVGSYFEGVDFTNCYFQISKLKDASFHKCDMTRSKFEGARFNSTSFVKCKFYEIFCLFAKGDCDITKSIFCGNELIGFEKAQQYLNYSLIDDKNYDQRNSYNKIVDKYSLTEEQINKLFLLLKEDDSDRTPWPRLLNEIDF
ncbi:MAG: pentapeptide repeat-containing protein [Rhizobiales bacterium]|nr:pentapeptide repeat-containing protein [Hyphomicrobiales bacterium]